MFNYKIKAVDDDYRKLSFNFIENMKNVNCFSKLNNRN